MIKILLKILASFVLFPFSLAILCLLPVTILFGLMIIPLIGSVCIIQNDFFLFKELILELMFFPIIIVLEVWGIKSMY